MLRIRGQKLEPSDKRNMVDCLSNQFVNPVKLLQITCAGRRIAFVRT